MCYRLIGRSTTWTDVAWAVTMVSVWWSERATVSSCEIDPSLFVETSASELVESSVLFPSLDSRDELHPRYGSVYADSSFLLNTRLWLSQGIGSCEPGKRVSHPRLTRCHRCTSTATPNRGECGRSLQHSSSLASLPRTVQGHRRHSFHCRPHEEGGRLHQSTWDRSFRDRVDAPVNEIRWPFDWISRVNIDKHWDD